MHPAALKVLCFAPTLNGYRDHRDDRRDGHCPNRVEYAIGCHDHSTRHGTESSTGPARHLSRDGDPPPGGCVRRVFGSRY